MERFRILWYNWKCWHNPGAGGAEVFTHEVAKRLVRMGHEVTLFTSRFKGSEKEEYSDGVRIVRDGGRYIVYLRAKRFYQSHRDEFDVVIDEINTRPFMTPKYVKRKIIIALIHQLAREFWFYETRFPLSYLGYYFLEDRWLKNYVNIPTLTVSDSTKTDLLTLGFRNVHIVPEGLNVKPLDHIPDKNLHPTVIFVGRLKKVKRPDHVIEVFRAIKEKIADAELWLVGDGYMKKDLERNAPSGVRFYGKISEAEKYDLLKRAHLVLAPGIREGWGLAVSEAGFNILPRVLRRDDDRNYWRFFQMKISLP